MKSLYQVVKRWFVLRVIAWKVNSLRRAIKKLGWVKTEAQLDEVAKSIDDVLWGDKPVDDVIYPPDEVR